jgi:hypothetical protein
MRILGQYVKHAALTSHVRVQERGEIPAVFTTFTFLPLCGAPKSVTCWSLVDSGASRIVVPGYFVDITRIDEDGRWHGPPDGLAARSAIREYSMTGIGGEYRGVGLPAEIKLDSQAIDGTLLVGVSTALQHPIIGREVLNRFIAQLNPFDGDLPASAVLG